MVSVNSDDPADDLNPNGPKAQAKRFHSGASRSRRNQLNAPQGGTCASASAGHGRPGKSASTSAALASCLPVVSARRSRAAASMRLEFGVNPTGQCNAATLMSMSGRGRAGRLPDEEWPRGFAMTSAQLDAQANRHRQLLPDLAGRFGSDRLAPGSGLRCSTNRPPCLINRRTSVSWPRPCATPRVAPPGRRPRPQAALPGWTPTVGSQIARPALSATGYRHLSYEKQQRRRSLRHGLCFMRKQWAG